MKTVFKVVALVAVLVFGASRVYAWGGGSSYSSHSGAPHLSADAKKRAAERKVAQEQRVAQEQEAAAQKLEAQKKMAAKK